MDADVKIICTAKRKRAMKVSKKKKTTHDSVLQDANRKRPAYSKSRYKEACANAN